jgi:uncharacterized protein YcfL
MKNHARLRHLTLAALAGLSLTMTACDTVKAPFSPKGDQVPKALYPKVVLQSTLADWIVLAEPVAAPAPNGGPLTVSVPIRLTSERPDQFARIQYRFIFLDASGVPLRSQSDWRYMRLEPRNQVFLQGNATDTTAVDWRCEIRSGT